MQFEPEESGEERRRRQRDYHAFLDAQVDARKKQPAEAQDDATDPAGNWLPVLPLSARFKHQAGAPYRVDPTTFARQTYKAPVVSNGGGVEINLDHRAEIANREEHFSLVGQRLEAEIQRRHLVERKLADLGQKLEMWMTASTASINSLGARDAVVTEVREQTRNLDTELAGIREWKNRVDASLALAPKVQEMTQQQVKALEEEARTRIQADEARSARFRQAVELVSSEVESLAHRLKADENGTRQRLAKVEAAFTGEAKGTSEATRQLGVQVQSLGSDVSESESKMSSLLQSLRMLEKRQQQEQQSVAAKAKTARDENVQSREKVLALSAAFSRLDTNMRDETERLREKMNGLSAAVSGSEKKTSSLLEALWRLETRQREQRVEGAGKTEEQISRRQMQESLIAATTVKLDLLRTSLADELSGLMGDTAKRAVESTNVPQLMTALRGRVELAEERLNNMADKSFRALEEELTGVRSEVKRLGGRIDTGPIATGLKVLTANTATAQAAAQSQLTELQDALSAEITARRRNAVRLAEAQAATKEGGRESAVQATSGLRARCLELEELVARLTRDIQTAQEDLSSQTQTQLAATQERNSRAVGKLEESLAGVRVQLAQQGADEDRNSARVAARIDELEGLIAGNKDLLREAEERARNAFGAIEAKFIDKMAGIESEEMARIEAIELALRGQGHSLEEAIEADHRSNKKRSEEIHADVKSLEGRMRTIIADAQEEDSARVGSLLQQAQEQVNREIARVRQTTDRVATEANTFRDKLNAVETSCMEAAQDLHRDLSTSSEASQSRMRLWAEDRMRKERAAMQESFERTQQQGKMVRALLDETVQAVSKEVELLRAESRARDLALEDSLDERASELEVKLTEIDNGAAKKRRVAELTKETGARIGGVERRVRQAEQELKKDLEVKLAVSSLVCTIADNASTQRLEQGSSEVAQLEALREAGAMEREASLRAELGKTNALVAGLQADIGAARGWQTGVDNLELKLMAHIEDLKAMVEAAESAAAIQKAVTSANLVVAAENALALENATKRKAAETVSEQKAEAAKVSSADQGQLARKRPKKKAMDFAALNDELEAEEEDSSTPSPASSSRSSGNSDADDSDSNDARRQSANGVVDERRQSSSEVAGAEQGKEHGKQRTGGDELFNPSGSDEGGRSGGERDVAGKESQEAVSDKAPVSPGSADTGRRRPASPTSSASYTPPLSPGSDITAAHSERRADTSAGQSNDEGAGSESEGDASSDDSESEDGSGSEPEGGRSRRPNAADEGEVTLRRDDEDSARPKSDDATGDINGDRAASDATSTSSSERNSDNGSEQETDDDDSDPGGKEGGGSIREVASPRRLGTESERSDRASSRGDDDSSGEDDGSRDVSGRSGSETGGGERSDLSDDDESGASDEADRETEGSVTPRGSEQAGDAGSGASDDSDRETEGSVTPRGSDLPGDVGSGASGESDGETEGSVTPRGSDASRSSAGESEEEREEKSADEGSQSSRSEARPPRSRGRTSTGKRSTTRRKQ